MAKSLFLFLALFFVVKVVAPLPLALLAVPKIAGIAKGVAGGKMAGGALAKGKLGAGKLGGGGKLGKAQNMMNKVNNFSNKFGGGDGGGGGGGAGGAKEPPPGFVRMRSYAGEFAPLLEKITPYLNHVPDDEKFSLAANVMMDQVSNGQGAAMNSLGDDHHTYSMDHGIFSRISGVMDKEDGVRDMVRSSGGGILGRIQGLDGSLGSSLNGANPLAGAKSGPLANLVNGLRSGGNPILQSLKSMFGGKKKGLIGRDNPNSVMHRVSGMGRMGGLHAELGDMSKSFKPRVSGKVQNIQPIPPPDIKEPTPPEAKVDPDAIDADSLLQAAAATATPAPTKPPPVPVTTEAPTVAPTEAPLLSKEQLQNFVTAGTAKTGKSLAEGLKGEQPKPVPMQQEQPPQEQAPPQPQPQQAPPIMGPPSFQMPPMQSNMLGQMNPQLQGIMNIPMPMYPGQFSAPSVPSAPSPSSSSDDSNKNNEASKSDDDSNKNTPKKNQPKRDPAFNWQFSMLKQRYEAQKAWLEQQQNQQRDFMKFEKKLAEKKKKNAEWDGDPSKDPARAVLRVQQEDKKNRRTWQDMLAQAEGKEPPARNNPKWLGKDKVPYM